MRGVLVLYLAGVAPLLAEEAPPNGDMVIRRGEGDGAIVATTTSRVAGAIHSVAWNGVEFIDSFDHGRQLQSASNFDCASHFTPETFNPTEAGSRCDGAGAASTSRLLHATHGTDWLQTTTQMSFWLRPGETSEGHAAKNEQELSNHLLTKRVQIGFRDMPHVLQHHVTFHVPLGESHKYAQFEALTGYMPPRFSVFLQLDPESGRLQPLDDGPGEINRPVAFASEDGRYAMGIISPDQPSPGFEHAGYGRFRFETEGVVKWNCVFRIRRAEGIEAGEYSFRCFVPIGDRVTVERTLAALHREFRELKANGS